MLNNFCLHVYAQKSLFIAENCNEFFFDTSHTPCEFGVSRAGSQLKKKKIEKKNLIATDEQTTGV